MINSPSYIDSVPSIPKGVTLARHFASGPHQAIPLEPINGVVYNVNDIRIADAIVEGVQIVASLNTEGTGAILSELVLIEQGDCLGAK